MCSYFCSCNEFFSPCNGPLSVISHSLCCEVSRKSGHSTAHRVIIVIYWSASSVGVVSMAVVYFNENTISLLTAAKVKEKSRERKKLQFSLYSFREKYDNCAWKAARTDGRAGIIWKRWKEKNVRKIWRKKYSKVTWNGNHNYDKVKPFTEDTFFLFHNIHGNCKKGTGNYSNTASVLWEFNSELCVQSGNALRLHTMDPCHDMEGLWE